MSEWIHIDEQRPEENQPVYYWFGFWNQVYEGFYQTGDSEIIDGEEYGGGNVFYGEGGFLGDDVTWWMPREELPEGVVFCPAGPTKKQKAACKYHPCGQDEERIY
jgi:hypothetical protein